MPLAVFLDRDGTLCIDEGYLNDPARLVLYPEALDAVRLLKKGGARLLLVTNQSGVGRGYFTEETLRQIHAELQRRLEGALDSIYYCPHRPDEGCGCRKPEPGMLERAMADWGLDPGDCYMIGDSERDVLAGRRAGCTTVQFLNGTNSAVEGAGVDKVSTSLLDAARWILHHAAARRQETPR